MNTKQPQEKTKAKRIGSIAVLIIAALFAVFFFYTENYYHADQTAYAALRSDGSVTVNNAAMGYYFNGPGTEDLLIFYPGAKVEETAYAPLLHKLAAEGIDVYLVAMPQRLAFFGIQRATDVFTEKLPDPKDYTVWTQAREIYDRFYIGGHSLGGAMAARYASAHPDKLEGILLLAAYPDQEIPDELSLLSAYGSEDGVLNRDKYEAARASFPDRYQEIELTGGNHAQFGNYGKQKGDGTASISAEEQQEATVHAILDYWGIE